MRRYLWATLFTLTCAALLSLSACDSEKISELTPGESSEADVRQKFGQPDDIWEDENGMRVLEFTRQPEGHRNWQARIDASGKLIGFKQLLTSENLAKVQTGMSELEVRRLIGKPGKVTNYDRQKQIAWEYRYLESASVGGMFTVTFSSPERKVLTTAKGPDPKDMNMGGK